MTKGSGQPTQRKRQEKETSAKSQSLGYPTLEKLIEEQDSNALNLEKSRKALNDLIRKSSDPQEKAHARQALLAYERFQHFFDEMIALREKMIKESAESSPKKQPASKTRNK